MKRNVLVDFSELGTICGFGEIARNYAPRLANNHLDDIHWVFLLPEAFVGTFGDHISYIRRGREREDLHRLGIHIDLWHATHQQFRYRGGDSNTIQLLTVHDLNFLREKKGVHRLRHIVQLDWRIRKSNYLTCISEYVKQDIQDHYNLRGKTIKVIYNGIDCQEEGTQRQPSFISNNTEPFFFTIGQIREKKNFQTLIPMMKYLPNHKLYICGDNHFSFARDLQQLILEEGEDKVFLTGKISDEEKRWLYCHADAFLFPSRLEGFGIPVLEAMRFRCKVFSSRFSSLPEVCGNHATYWEDYEPSTMAAVVRKGVEDWEKEGIQATKALEYSLSFNYETYTEAYVQLYRQLLAEGK